MRTLFTDGWEFAKLPFGCGRDEALKTGAFSPVRIPHDWLIGQTEDLYETSTGWYRKSFDVQPAGRHCLIIFDGVYMDTSVYINGVHAGEWKYGYSAFCVDATSFLRDGRNLLEVEVRHKSPNSRWYSGAGIFRNVWLEMKEEDSLIPDGLYVHTEQDQSAQPQKDAWKITARAEIACGEGSREKLWLETGLFTADGAFVCGSLRRVAECVTGENPTPLVSELGGTANPDAGEQACKKGDTRVLLCTEDILYTENPARWSPEHPAFYRIRTSLYREASSLPDAGAAACERESAVLHTPGTNTRESEPVAAKSSVENMQECGAGARELPGEKLPGLVLLDVQESRTGFRVFELDPQRGFFLNGEHRKLNGVCEHHDFGALGSAFSKDACRRKFRKLKEMGVNALRTSHNMPARELMDIADEMGILVVSEAFDMWERPKTTFDYARFFDEWEDRDVASWIRRDRNHPSVLLWSIGNEIYDTHADARGQEITRMLMEQVISHDPLGNAKPTIGSNYMPWEGAQACADILKIAGYNYSERYYPEHHEAHPDWVIYGSETSSIVYSRGVYHFPLSEPILSDEDLQCSALGNSRTSWGARSMERCILEDKGMPWSLGQFLWTGFDYIGEPTPYHTKNSYFGQLDTAGFPKDAFYVWKAGWTSPEEQPFVHVFPYWDFNEGQMIDIRVCSNLPEVELFVNGQSLGRKACGAGVIADYRAEYHAGAVKAVAYDAGGNPAAQEERHSFGESAAIVLTPEISGTELRADGESLLYVAISTIDADGYPVENASDRVTVCVSGAAELAGLDNGDSTDYDSWQGNCRKLFNGKLMAILRAGKKAGTCLMRVDGPGLRAAELLIPVIAADPAEAPRDPIPVVPADPAEAPLDLIPVIPADPADAHRDLKELRPVRKVELSCTEERVLTPEHPSADIRARILPKQAGPCELVWQLVTLSGIPVPSALIQIPEAHSAENDIHSTGSPQEVSAGEELVRVSVPDDGNYLIRCLAKNAQGSVRIISQLEITVQGFGKACKNPYEEISGGLFDYTNGNTSPGNEKGVATSRDGMTVFGFSQVDFGPFGSDELTLPVFSLNDHPTRIQVWDGIAGEEGALLLGDLTYSIPSIWNVYQPETWKLDKRLTGIHTLSFVTWEKMHFRGFSFKKPEKAFMELPAASADRIYGDSFRRQGDAVLGIGNNVTLIFEDMDFGPEGTGQIVLRGHAVYGKNTIHIRFSDGETESRQVVEFDNDKGAEQAFRLEPVCGKQTVSFVFMPGSNFDLEGFRFEKR